MSIMVSAHSALPIAFVKYQQHVGFESGLGMMCRADVRVRKLHSPDRDGDCCLSMCLSPFT